MAARTDRQSRLHTEDARYWYRRTFDRGAAVLMGLCTLSAVAVLTIIIGYVVYRGASYINWEFVTSMPVPLGQSGGGIAHAIVGSLIIVSMATSMAVPTGVGAAIFLSEFPGSLLVLQRLL